MSKVETKIVCEGFFDLKVWEFWPSLKFNVEVFLWKKIILKLQDI